jgi:hypothetical protein
VVFNIPLLFSHKFNLEHCSQETVCLAYSRITALLNNPSVHLGFDLSKYSVSAEAINCIAMLCTQHPQRIVLSGGLTFKTDLTTFGGDGYRFGSLSPHHSSILEQFQRLIPDERLLSQLVVSNQLKLLTWKGRIEKVELIVMWVCDKCGLSQSEKV